MGKKKRDLDVFPYQEVGVSGNPVSIPSPFAAEGLEPIHGRHLVPPADDRIKKVEAIVAEMEVSNRIVAYQWAAKLRRALR